MWKILVAQRNCKTKHSSKWNFERHCTSICIPQFWWCWWCWWCWWLYDDDADDYMMTMMLMIIWWWCWWSYDDDDDNDDDDDDDDDGDDDEMMVMIMMMIWLHVSRILPRFWFECQFLRVTFKLEANPVIALGGCPRPLINRKSRIALMQ